MYKDWEYFFKEAELLAKSLNVSYSKVTSGLDKGRFRASFDRTSPTYENFYESNLNKGKVGFDFKGFSDMAGDDKEQALKYLLNQTASYLYAYNVQNNSQPISEHWAYFLKNKDKKSQDIHFYSKIGRNIYDYFRVLIGDINLKDFKVNSLEGDLRHEKTSTIESETPKEIYFRLKTNAKKEWLAKNERYKAESHKFRYVKINTFVFDEQNIPEIEAHENKDEQPKQSSKIKVSFKDLKDSIDISSLQNNGFFKVGFSSNYFSKTKIVVGRQKKLIFPNNDQRKSYFLVVELDEIIASHNEKNFASSKDYPTNKNGNNINDRNYSGDKNAQAKVLSVAQNLLPEIIISTSATASGTPIITIDGVVVSGNNRVMSLKIAKNDFPEKYEEYKKVLFQELEYGGYDITMAQVYEEFKAPILVRLDADFQTYETTELNKYNQGRSKTERSIDMTIRVQDKLENSGLCNTQLINLISELEIVSEIYNMPDYVKRFKKILLDCNLIGENDISNLFTENSLSENGKNFYDNLLLAMVLDRNSLEISQNNGIKSFIKNIVNAIIPLIKNESFAKGNILKFVNNAVLIKNAMINGNYTDIAAYTTENSIFGEESEFKNEKSLIIASLLNDKANTFKNALIKYNNSIEQNEGNSLFGDPMSEDEIFKLTFEHLVDPKLLKAISILKNETKIEQVVEETLPGPKQELLLRIEKIEKTLKYAENKTEIESYLNKLKQTLKYI